MERFRQINLIPLSDQPRFSKIELQPELNLETFLKVLTCQVIRESQLSDMQFLVGPDLLATGLAGAAAAFLTFRGHFGEAALMTVASVGCGILFRRDVRQAREIALATY